MPADLLLCELGLSKPVPFDKLRPHLYALRLKPVPFDKLRPHLFKLRARICAG